MISWFHDFCFVYMLEIARCQIHDFMISWPHMFTCVMISWFIMCCLRFQLSHASCYLFVVPCLRAFMISCFMISLLSYDCTMPTCYMFSLVFRDFIFHDFMISPWGALWIRDVRDLLLQVSWFHFIRHRMCHFCRHISSRWASWLAERCARAGRGRRLGNISGCFLFGWLHVLGDPATESKEAATVHLLQCC